MGPSVRSQHTLWSILKTPSSIPSDNAIESTKPQAQPSRGSARTSVSPKRSRFRAASSSLKDELTRPAVDKSTAPPQRSNVNTIPSQAPMKKEQCEAPGPPSTTNVSMFGPNKRIRSILKAPSSPQERNKEVEQSPKTYNVEATPSPPLQKEESETGVFLASNVPAFGTNTRMRSILKAPSSANRNEEGEQGSKQADRKDITSHRMNAQREAGPSSAANVPAFGPNTRIRSILKAPSSPQERNKEVEQNPTQSDRKDITSRAQSEAGPSPTANVPTFGPNNRIRSILKAPSPSKTNNDEVEQKPEDVALAALGALVGRKKVSTPGKRNLRRSQSCRVKSHSPHFERPRANTEPEDDVISAIIGLCPPNTVEKSEKEMKASNTKKSEDKGDPSRKGKSLEAFLKQKRDADLATEQQQQQTNSKLNSFPESAVASPSPSLLSTMTIRPGLKQHLKGLPSFHEADDDSSPSQENKHAPPTAKAADEVPKKTQRVTEETAVQTNVILPPDWDEMDKRSQVQSAISIQETKLHNDAPKAVVAVNQIVPSGAIVCAQLRFSVGKVEVDYVSLPPIYRMPYRQSSAGTDYSDTDVHAVGPSAA